MAGPDPRAPWRERLEKAGHATIVLSVFGFALIGAMAGVVDEIAVLRGWLRALFVLVLLRVLWELFAPVVQSSLADTSDH